MATCIETMVKRPSNQSFWSAYIKTLKAKIRQDAQHRESGGYNSPWNIAIDFKVGLSFGQHDIETMFQDYSRYKQIQPDISAIAATILPVIHTWLASCAN